MSKTQLNKYLLTALCLLSFNLYAGAGFICDNFGNSCIQPGGNCSHLIPPTFICGYDSVQKEIINSTSTIENENSTFFLFNNTTQSAACCSWGENIPQCMPGC